jgi:hypothetical protein
MNFQNLVGNESATAAITSKALKAELSGELGALAPELDLFDSNAAPQAHLASGMARTADGLGCSTFVGKGCIADAD